MKHASRFLILSLLFFLSGFSALSVELVFVKYLGYVFGTTAHALGTVLAAFMLGLSLGNLLGGKYSERIRRRLRWYGCMELGVGAFALIAPLLFRAMRDFVGSFKPGFVGREVTRAAVVTWLIFVPALAMGISFPAALCLQRADRANSSRRVGVTYAVNTAGTIVGSTVTGFWLIEAFGSQGTMRLLAGGMTAMSLPLLGVIGFRPLRYAALLVALWCCASFVWADPWDIARMTSGSNIYFAPGFDRSRNKLVHYDEDGLS